MFLRRSLLLLLLPVLVLACRQPQVKKAEPAVVPAVSVRPDGPGYLGVVFVSGIQGLRIVDVFPDSPASRAGLIKGDTLVGAMGRPIGGVYSFRAKIRSMREGQKLPLRVQNILGRERRVVVVINEMPEGLTLYGKKPTKRTR